MPGVTQVKAVLLATTCAVLVASTHIAPPAGGYALRVAYPLTSGPDQVAGRLELLEDARIRPGMRVAIADAYGGNPCTDRPPAVLRLLCGELSSGSPLRPAMLRLLDERGHVVATRMAERPLAELSVARLYGTKRRTFLFTVDLSAGIGSYSGPYTRLAEPDASGFGWLTADSAGLRRDTITLVATLKSAWRRAPRPDGRGDDILTVACRPDFTVPDSSAAQFVLTFQRLSFDGRRWILRQRRARGCYESDEPFPSVTLFP